ncbi:MAG: hypothetical protein IK045_04380 [Bacteroidales bacterium]|nr:hypothetical protein [Bacteroidales bacterium]
MTLCATACKEKEEPEDKTDPVRRVSLTITAEQVETRTVIGEPQAGGVPILWEDSDEIWVRSARQEQGTPGDRFVTSASGITDGGRKAVFTGETMSSGPYVAVYPHCLVSSESDNEKVVLKVPAKQSYVRGSFARNANLTAAVWEEGTTARFESIAGTLRLRLNGHSAVSKIVLADKDETFPLWGECILTVGEGAISAEWRNDDPKRNEITMNVSGGVPLDDAVAADFYFAVPAGAFAQGYVCTIYNAAGLVAATITEDRPCKVEAGSILTVENGEPSFAKGSGTEDDPYQIAVPADLARLADLCNGSHADDFADKHYRQTANLNMTGVPHACIGASQGKPFMGYYDGGGFKISNLAPTPSSDGAAGMFGYTYNADIRNLRIDGYTNGGTNGEQGVIAGNAFCTVFDHIDLNVEAHFVLCACGGIAGVLEGGAIRNCTLTGRVHDEKNGTYQGVTVVSAVGGIAGVARNAVIENCTVSGDVSASGEQLGGIVGQMVSSSVSGCKVTDGSTVTGDNYYVGGIAGEMLTGGSISRCEVQAHVVCWYPCAAGIVAWIQSGDISDCTVGSNALVRTGQDKAGGITAYIYHKNTAQTVNIRNCAVYCDVAASYTVGGIVGECNLSHDSSKVNIWNCAYIGGEIIDAGYAKSKWTMVGGLVAWVRIGSTSATVNIVNCFSDPATIRCDFPQSDEVDMGGFIGEQGGSGGNISIQGCYNTLAPGRAIINGKKDIPSNYYQYAAFVGNPTKVNLDHAYCLQGLQEMGKSQSGTVTASGALTVSEMTGGTLLGKLNEFVDSFYGPMELRRWVAGVGGYPILEGMAGNPSVSKKKPLRVSLIGDSLSSFDGYAPHCYQGDRAPNGYRCHYPTGDGNVTSASQTYWYMLTYDYLSNAEWDTNLAFSGTAVTRCTNTSYSDKYWYGQDFCARYIENGGLGSPDIVIINGGANDWAHNCYNILGNTKLQRYPTTEPHRPDDASMNAVYAVADACTTLDQAKNLPDATFVEAYVKLVKMITLQYPYVKIVVLIHDTLTPDVEESLLHIAGHYSANCRAVDLYAVNGFNDFGWDFEYLFMGYQPNMPKHDLDWSKIVTTGDLRQNCSDHYSAVAMKFIAEKIYSEIGSWLEEGASYNESGGGSIGNFDNINGTW